MQTMRSGRTLFIDNKVKRTLIFVEILDSKIIQFCKKAWPRVIYVLLSKYLGSIACEGKNNPEFLNISYVCVIFSILTWCLMLFKNSWPFEVWTLQAQPKSTFKEWYTSLLHLPRKCLFLPASRTNWLLGSILGQEDRQRWRVTRVVASFSSRLPPPFHSWTSLHWEVPSP